MDFSFLTGSVLSVVIVFGLVVFIHELGHFLAARHYGIAVSRFSIGFGPELFGWTDKLGTRWKISLLPLGGYVMFLGDADASSNTVDRSLKEEDKNKSIHYRSPWQRIVVNIWGPLANYLLAMVVFFIVFFAYGKPGSSNVIFSFAQDSPAKEAGIMIGDEIVSLNGLPVKDFVDFQKAMGELKSPEVTLKIKRSSSEDHEISLKAKEMKGRYVLGVSTGQSEKGNLVDSLVSAFVAPFKVSYETLKAISYMIMNAKSDGLGGPIAIIKGIASSAQEGLMQILFYTAMLSTSLGFFNLLPIPTLDGGHILFCLIEIVRGRPVKEKIQEWVFMIGLGFLLLLFAFVTYKDIFIK